GGSEQDVCSEDGADDVIKICIFFFASRRRHTRSKRDWSSDVCSSDLQHISKILESYNYSGILHLLTSENEKNNRLPNIYYENKVDGFIILGQTDKNYLKKIKSIHIPLVFLDIYDEYDDVDSVITDNFCGADELTNYLIRKRHQVLCVIGNLYSISISSIHDRFLGYYKSLLEHNIILNDDYIINDRDEEDT